MEKNHVNRARLRYYIAGYVNSIILTLGAYLFVEFKLYSGNALLLLVLALALLQLFVQLVFFLHLHEEKQPRWNSIAFFFMAFFVLTIVLGSLWIMKNLDYNMSSPHEIDEYIMEEEGIYR